jgi:G3E family GTPase
VTATPPSIPLFVLTGFLGSGKTTLLARAIRHAGFARTAVVINEMGEIGLDHDLVRASSEDLIELDTGCLCCKARGDLAELLADLLRRRDAGEVMAFERIVVETSGIADPAPLLQLTMLDDGLRRRLHLGGVIATVDAIAGAATLDAEPQAPRQVAVADRLVITKTDMAGGVPADLQARLDRLNPAAERIVASFGSAAPEHIFAEMPLRPAASAAGADRWLAADAAAPTTGGDQFPVDASVTSHSFVIERPLRAVTIALLLETLAEHCGSDLLRLKGIVHLAETPDRPAVVHGVQHVFHPVELLDGWPGADRRSRLVLIGRSLHRGWIEALIRAIDLEVSEQQAPVGSAT